MQNAESIVDKLVALSRELAGIAWPLIVQGMYNRALVEIFSSVVAIVAFWLVYFLILRHFKLAYGVNREEYAGCCVFSILPAAITIIIILAACVPNIPFLLNPEAATALRLLGR